jgi:hypothetical protein
MRELHAFHQRSVLVSADSGSGDAGNGSYELCQVSENGTRSPGSTTNSPTVVNPLPVSGTGVAIASASGPATAWNLPPTLRTHGTTQP